MAANMQSAAKKLIDLIRDSKPSLELAEYARDRMNHFKSGVSIFKHLQSLRKKKGVRPSLTPRLHPDQTIRS